MTKEKRNLAQVIFIFILVYIADGISGVTNLVENVKNAVTVMLKSIDEVIKQFNNGLGILPAALTSVVAFVIVKYLLSGCKANKKEKSALGKIYYAVTEKMITPVLNWINGIVFK